MVTKAPVNSEAKDMASVTFFKITWHVKASGPLCYLRQAVWRHFYGFIVNFFYVWNLATFCFNCLGDNCSAFFLWNFSSVLWNRKLHQTFLSAWDWLENNWIFLFWVNCPFKSEIFQLHKHFNKLYIFELFKEILAINICVLPAFKLLTG